MNTTNEGQRAKVDQQDGGPGSHNEDDSGGAENDVASGGVSERAHDNDDTSHDDGLERDVNRDPDTAG
ncbi:hypothetical protein GCM10011492_27790 [Flexivirga endophytica]|uniref:Uncharacterized protein n=1 Tax=Flexivirga endophytica TaxID=1849103 RepID=A0A916T9N8_9MICO|nr:hypothetical protein [Flexivirga endophytica]GGB35581.1 hypothetical protein GCM10011492_27790 [Flexivirga endophytica]GHB43301.1 hypothetical protein GCM10008112_10170 [Flexivirga endophytica]